MAKFIDSDVNWFDHIHSRIKSVFLDQLTYQGCFAEVHCPDESSPTKYHAGIWGWNTWCGIHDMIPLAEPEVCQIMQNTFELGLRHVEPETGLLPHTIIIGPQGTIGSVIEYRTYSGAHGEGYNLDNIICWAKMMLEFVLYTRNLQWFTTEKLAIVEGSINYILDNLRKSYNPHLIAAGIEGDWTENTNWEADNANVNVNMHHCLQLLAGVESLFGSVEKVEKYLQIADDISLAYNLLSSRGGFWDEKRGHYIHGNDGKGERIYGDDYFETTANIFAILWGTADQEKTSSIWKFIDSHPEIELPYPVLTNLYPRSSPRRPDYGHSVSNGDTWFTLGAHAAVARFCSGYIDRATRMFKAIIDYELKEGTIHNNIYPDGSVNADWSPEMANYGSLFTILTEGLLGLRPTSEGLLIHPYPLGGMSYLKMLKPLYYAGKPFYLNVKFGGQKLIRVRVKAVSRPAHDIQENAFVLRPYLPSGATVVMEYGA